MAIYFVGDIQGCYSELNTLLSKVAFSTKDDQLYVAGDIVARGPDSLSALRLIKSLKDSVKVVLGNHDLHLLSVFHGLKKVNEKDKLSSLISAPDADELLYWLRHQPLIQKIPNEETYMSHAGLSPQWTPEIALKQAHIAHQNLTSNEFTYWLQQMYGAEPNSWQKAHNKVTQFRFTINALTRMRYCNNDGNLDFACKTDIQNAPKELTPWFDFKHINNNTQWIFGHWAALMGNCPPKNIYALDTGCVWGNYLSILRWHDKALFTEKTHKK